MSFFDSIAAAYSPSVIGDAVEGVVLKSFEKQQTGGDIVKGKFVPNDTPKFFKNGQPAMSLVVVVQTDNVTADDNGQRSVYINRPSRMFSATLDALKAIGAKDINPGDTFRVEFTGLDPESAQGNAKLYKVTITPGDGEGGSAEASAEAATDKAAVTNDTATSAEAAELLRRLEELQKGAASA